MNGPEFIAVHLDLFSHPKFLHLARLIGPIEEAAYRLMLLWVWTARYAPDGVTNGVGMGGLSQAIGPHSKVYGAPPRTEIEVQEVE